MPSDRLASDDPAARAPLTSAADCWIFDMDGCLVDSLTGSSLRPGARELLEHLARTGHHIILWSAGGDAYARTRAEEFGVDHLVGGYFAKDGRDVDGRYLTTHLPLHGRQAVFVDDRREDLARDLDVLAVSPYLSDNPHDHGLQQRRAAPRRTGRTQRPPIGCTHLAEDQIGDIMAGPLSGVRVVEVANWTFVPAAGAVLADLGADVIKVEPPNGDPQRALLNMLNLKGGGPNPFIEIPNRGKRSVTCDLTTDAGRQALTAIVRTADVFVTSNLAPIRTKLRIDVDDIRAMNPDIIYVRGTGWGNDGPMADVGGYDMACGWASSGMAFKMTPGGIEPLPQPPAFFDLQGANTIAGAIGIALFKRSNTGETSVVDVSLLHVGMWALSPDIVGSPYMGDIANYGDRTKAPNPLVNGYATKDQRWIYFVCLQPDRFWDEFCTLLGRPDLITDPRYDNSAHRYENSVALVGELDTVFSTMTLDDVKKTFAGFSGVWAPVLRPSELHTHPQVDANGFLPSVTAHDGSDYRIVAAPAHFSGHTTAPHGPAPELGQHTEEVLLEAGLDWDAITVLREGGGLG